MVMTVRMMGFLDDDRRADTHSRRVRRAPRGNILLAIIRCF